MVCIDASVLVAQSLPQDAFHEPSHQFIRTVVREGKPRCAPVLVLSECAGAIARRTQEAELGAETARLLVEFFGFLRPISEDLGHRAAKIASSHGLRGADALYVATAEDQEAQLVTWDQEMLDRGGSVVETATPKEWMPSSPSG